MSGATKTAETVLPISQDMVILNKLGLHARPAALFVKTANRFVSHILVERDHETVSGKSIMGLMMLAAGQGSILRVQAEGTDAAQALRELAELVKRKFDED